MKKSLTDEALNRRLDALRQETEVPPPEALYRNLLAAASLPADPPRAGSLIPIVGALIAGFTLASLLPGLAALQAVLWLLPPIAALSWVATEEHLI